MERGPHRQGSSLLSLLAAHWLRTLSVSVLHWLLDESEQDVALLGHFYSSFKLGTAMTGEWKN